MLASASIFNSLIGIAVDVISLFMALLSSRGIDTQSLQARGEQRRSIYFNNDRDIPQDATGTGTTATKIGIVIEVGPAYESCRAAARVARDFEMCRRRHDLSFAHHREVAGLPPVEADALLDWCEETLKPRSTRELRGAFGES
jgi:hypothetical protein